MSIASNHDAGARRILSLIDLTNLDDGCTTQDVMTLCWRAQGKFGSTAAVCVWPQFVSLAKSLLIDTTIKVATVVNFPQGSSDITAVIATTTTALTDGADEIDMVLPYHALLAGQDELVSNMLTAVRATIVPPAHWKIILETGELGDERIIARASELAVAAGADFIKTSTGKTKVSATPAAVATILQVIAASNRPVGLKPSGGIRTVADAQQYLDLADAIMGPMWATPDTFRFGASGLLDVVEAQCR